MWRQYVAIYVASLFREEQRKMLKAGIIGYGIVGEATAKVIKEEVDLFILDPEIGHTDNISDCDILFICINEKDHTMSNLSELVNTLKEQNKKCFFVIRTTIIPGTIKELTKRYKREFVYMPEFLREWNIKKDTESPDKIVIGTENKGIFEMLATLFSDTISLESIIKVKPIEAELAKLALNSLALIKVVFAEELFDLAKEHKASYKNIYRIFELDQNINERHLKTCDRGYRGADGKCLPKDADFLIRAGKEKSRMALLETAEILNNLFLKGK